MTSPLLAQMLCRATIAGAIRRALSAVCLLCALLPVAGGGTGDDPASITYRAKVRFLFNFLRFAEWPESALPARAPFRLAIAADEPTYTLIARCLSGKAIRGHAIVVEKATMPDDQPPPHLLYLTTSAPGAARALASRYAAAPVLTVGEFEGFARREGMLNFVWVNDEVRLELNLAAARRAGLRISSRVSKLAILVRPES